MKVGKELLTSSLMVALLSGPGLVLLPLGSSAVAQNPVPHINQPLVPDSGAPKSALILTVNGSGFVSGATVRWNGSAQPPRLSVASS
jgi:hypothetical protein